MFWGIKSFLWPIMVLVCVALVSAVPSSFSDQGTDVKYANITVQSANLTITIWNDPTSTAQSALFYNNTFVNGIINGTWNVRINTTSLEYNGLYYKDYAISGQDLDFDGNERLAFYSPLGLINNQSFVNTTSVGGWMVNQGNTTTDYLVNINNNLSADTVLAFLNWSYLLGIPIYVKNWSTDIQLVDEKVDSVNLTFINENTSIWTAIGNRLLTSIFTAENSSIWNAIFVTNSRTNYTGSKYLTNITGKLDVNETRLNQTINEVSPLSPMGEVSLNDNALGTAVTQNVWTPVNGTWSGNSESMTFLNYTNGTLRYTGERTMFFHIACTLSASSSSVHEIMRAAVFKNGVLLSAGEVQQQLYDPGDIASTAIHVATTLSTNDTFQLRILDESGAATITVTYANLFAMGMRME